jgi:hypothetical protein
MLATACAATTYEGGDTSTTAAATGASTVDASTLDTAMTVVAAEPEDLLPQLADEAAGLSRVMIDGGDDDAAVARIDALWQAARQPVAASRPELLADFDANVRRCRTAVQFRRAADADKAAANLRALVDAYLA